MSPADLATLSLLDPDQGNCRDGHPCRLAARLVGWRRCANGEFLGRALICWNVTLAAIEGAQERSAHPLVVAWAMSFLEDRDAGRT